MIERRRYRVSGRVQGVGFRAFVWRQAQRLEVAGWVRNRRDGSVEVLADANPDEHGKLLAVLQRGPSLSMVSDVDVRTEAREIEELVGFAVVPDE